MRGFHSSSFDPQTLVILEAAFDEAWLLNAVANSTVRPDELARSVLRLAMDGECDPVRRTTARSRDCFRRRRGGRPAERLAARRRRPAKQSGMGNKHRNAGERGRGEGADERRLHEWNGLA